MLFDDMVGRFLFECLEDARKEFSVQLNEKTQDWKPEEPIPWSLKGLLFPILCCMSNPIVVPWSSVLSLYSSVAHHCLIQYLLNAKLMTLSAIPQAFPKSVGKLFLNTFCLAWVDHICLIDRAPALDVTLQWKSEPTALRMVQTVPR